MWEENQQKQLLNIELLVNSLIVGYSLNVCRNGDIKALRVIDFSKLLTHLLLFHKGITFLVHLSFRFSALFFIREFVHSFIWSLPS